MSGHTPGPWGTMNYYEYVAAKDVIICSVRHNPNGFDYQAEANASLIAAAPDMLAALKLILQSHEPNCPGETCHLAGIDLARAAIAKAEGT